MVPITTPAPEKTQEFTRGLPQAQTSQETSFPWPQFPYSQKNMLTHWAPNRNLVKVHPDLQKQQVARTAICRECSEGTAFKRDTRPNHPSAQSVEDELPRGSVPRTCLATGCCSSRTQKTWHPQEQQKHLTLLEPHRQPVTCPSPKSLPRAKQTVHCTLTSPRSEEGQVAAPAHRGFWA